MKTSLPALLPVAASPVLVGRRRTILVRNVAATLLIFLLLMQIVAHRCWLIFVSLCTNGYILALLLTFLNILCHNHSFLMN